MAENPVERAAPAAAVERAAPAAAVERAAPGRDLPRTAQGQPEPSSEVDSFGSLKFGADDAIFDKRALLIGLILAAALVSLGVVWRVAYIARNDSANEEPKAVDFAVEEPKPITPSIANPTRDIVRESPAERVDLPSIPDEKPDVHITRTPSPGYVGAEVIQSPNIEDSPKQEFKIDLKDIGVMAPKNDNVLDDAPEKIDVVADVVSFPLQPLAADTIAAADIFKYKDPTPSDKPQIYTMATGPRPAGR